MTTPQSPTPQPGTGGPVGPSTGAGPATGTRPAAPGTKPGQPAPQRPGVVRRTTDGFKRILLVVLGALIALFAVLNRQQVEVHWIFGKAVQTPLILALVVTLLVGVVIGYLVAKLGNRAASGGGR